MNNMDLVFVTVKPCYGQYEKWDNSWHCKGCPIARECKRKKREIKLDEQSK